MAKRAFFTSSVFTPLADRWHSARTHCPWLPAVLTLLALNVAYFAWSHGAPAASERAPSDFNASAMVLLTPEEGQRREAQAQAQAQAQAARAKAAPVPVPDMLVEYETTPAKEIPPDR